MSFLPFRGTRAQRVTLDSSRAMPIRRCWRLVGLFALAGVLMCGALTPHDAQARRLGGGRSFGRQTQIAPRQALPPSQAAQPSRMQQAAPRPAPAQSPRNRWLGPIAGLAAGLGIAALLSHLGLGGAFAGALSNILTIGLVILAVYWIFRLLTRRRDRGMASYTPGAHEPAVEASGVGALRAGMPPDLRYGARTPHVHETPSSGGASAAGFANPAPSVPTDFDSEAFLRSAKVSFIRMQSAWDAGDVADIREFTTPETFAEIKVDLAQRGSTSNRTDVVRLDADLLGVEESAEGVLASVRFHGLIREAEGAAAEPFAEVWNFSRRAQGTEGWLLGGIQQES